MHCVIAILGGIKMPVQAEFRIEKVGMGRNGG